MDPIDPLPDMKRVADWQFQQLETLGNSLGKRWVEATFWAGVLALHRVSQDSKYLDATRTWAEGNGYQLHKAPTTHADHQCAAQAYFELYLADPTPANLTRMVNPAKVSFDEMVTTGTNTWTWVDALFMSPPGLARLHTITQDPKYLTHLHSNWSASKASMFSVEHALWWRDPAPAVTSGEPQDIFWSRGNGWVMAGSARTLEHVPADDPQRDLYVRNLEDMAAALVAIQSADGLWRSDLLHPESYPEPESSGTAFFTYGLAWGIRHGILDPAVYREPALKAWRGFVSTCVGADGSLGCVQPPGAEPGPSALTDTAPYGVGAFLLAGSEIAGL